MYLLQNINYTCFCASSVIQMSQCLFAHYFLKCGKAPFDVVISSPQECLLSRPYGYVCLYVDNKKSTQELVNFISNHKEEININYPILLRLILGNSIINIDFPPNYVQTVIDEKNIFLEIN